MVNPYHSVQWTLHEIISEKHPNLDAEHLLDNTNWRQYVKRDREAHDSVILDMAIEKIADKILEEYMLKGDIQEKDLCNDFNSEEFFKTATVAEVEFCLENGCSAVIERDYNKDEEYDEQIDTPLHLAARHSKKPGVIESLVDHGGDINATTHGDGGAKPIHYAAIWNDSVEVLEMLIKCGADVNGPLYAVDEFSDYYYGNFNNAPPLHLAAEFNSNPEIIESLINLGADKQSFSREGLTALHHAAFRDDDPGIIDVLINHGLDVDCRSGGLTPLHHAALQNKTNSDVAARLIHHGADVNAEVDYRNHYTPLHMAAKNIDNPGIVSLLIKHGASVNMIDVNGRTPLHEAIKSYAKPEVITELIVNGADVNIRVNQTGETPLHMAVFNARDNHPDSFESIKILLNTGADASIKDAAGKRPFDIIDEKSDLHGTELYERLRDAKSARLKKIGKGIAEFFS